MEIKTSELSGQRLDWAVARAKGGDCGTRKNDRTKMAAKFGGEIFSDWRPSIDWSQGGPLIESHEIQVAPMNGRKAPRWIAMIQDVDAFGPTPLIAASRAIVLAKLGDTVTVPNEMEG